jgi:ribonuclease HI
MKQVYVYTDGACSGNPGPGGWGWIMVDEKNDGFHRGSGGEKNTTNNRMELMAVIDALGIWLKTPHELTIITDSKYVMQGMTEWIVGWKKRNWVGSNKKPVKNRDLWERLDALCAQRPGLKWKWVKGHSGDKWNEEVDQLAVSAIPKD